MAPTRERPGIVRVRISDRDRWHVVDPVLTPAEAEEAVRAHRAANAPTNASVLRRVLAWTPGVAALLVLAASVAASIVVVRQLELEEWPARAAAVVGLAGATLVLTTVVGLALLAVPWGGPAARADVSYAPGVRELDERLEAVVDDDVPVVVVWRLRAALSLHGELDLARWSVADVIHSPLGTEDVEDVVDTLDDPPRDRDSGEPSEHPALRALRAARLEAAATAVAIGDEADLDVRPLVAGGGTW